MNHRRNVGKNVKDYYDVEVTRAWYGEQIDGSKLKEREANTSHSIDVENMKNNVRNK